MRVRILDLDRTVYRTGCEFDRQHMRMLETRAREITRDSSPDLCERLMKQHGATSIGVHNLYGMRHMASFNRYLEQQDYNLLSRDYRLINWLSQSHNILFTNSPRDRAFKTLRALGVDDLFSRAICLEDMIVADSQPIATLEETEGKRITSYLKPHPLFFEHLKSEYPDAIFYDDSAANIATALSVGLKSIQVDDIHTLV